MHPQAHIATVLFILSFTFCHLFAFELPSQLDFLCSLFNATKDEVEKIVEKFSLSGDVSLDEIRIIQYFPDGYNYSARLSDTEGLQEIELNLEENIVIITHGFFSSGTADWVINMAQSYHSIGINNTLAIDWQEAASTINYVGSARATKNVGKLVGDWLFNVVGNNVTSVHNVHLVGHSLGAHVSGFIGQRIQNLTKEKIGRISGLDVAAPLFEYPIELPTYDRLTVDDAEKVEAYHTDKGLLGFKSELAHQDFYINYGGPIQPSCLAELTIIQKIQCSHSFSHEIFTKTITSINYIARECSSARNARYHLCDINLSAIMGEFNNATSLNGTFYGNTDANGNPKNL